MRLRDSVEIWEQVPTGELDSHRNPIIGPPTFVASVPAALSYTSAEADPYGGRTGYLEQLRVILAPFDYDVFTMHIRWRSQKFTNDGPPMIRRRNGKDHHLTIPLKKFT